MVLLDQDAFLNELTKLYQRSRTSGSVYVSMKRHTGPVKGGREKTDKKPSKQEAAGAEPENRCLIRATDGKKEKFSCIVGHKDQVRFQMMFANILKVHCDALKKRDKKDAKRKPKPLASQ
mmetsp:Transcript_20423/g.35108  ORF Transcript_20423/g.35108 Transcript_20423/m.35108 type:complete len:120 (+) Transcript_20423:52-411(+)|eukprot:CAMPEP_0196658936 /NCGR_PEP_ID=MMETSP1086-20130531/32383_1 /TAXON_ID=77921 /ORGANISM="Cyanoptyche  gloeocystis , Strain SAG4.97" /LENGTH=119 /DNA_ID=CAMNT_0041992735 /DNA_START=61 /DNA_END=420 /DNA_ORIENTATION=+